MAERMTIREMAAAALEKWRRKNTPEAIAKRVDEVMDQHAERLAMAALGFKWDSWRREYEMDPFHDSALKDRIRAWAIDAAEQWMAAHKAEIVTEAAPSLIKAMTSEYRQVAKRAIADVVDRTAHQVAVEFAREAMARVLADEETELSEDDLRGLFVSAVNSGGSHDAGLSPVRWNR